MSSPDDPTVPGKPDPDGDPKRDADKPQYPAPPAAGEHGTGHNPGGAGGAPPPGVKPEQPGHPPQPLK